MLEGAVDRFVYLHHGLAAILVFLGAEFVLEGFGIHVPVAASLPFMALAVAVSIALPDRHARGSPAEEKARSPEKKARTDGDRRRARRGGEAGVRDARRDGDAGS